MIIFSELFNNISVSKYIVALITATPFMSDPENIWWIQKLFTLNCNVLYVCEISILFWCRSFTYQIFFIKINEENKFFYTSATASRSSVCNRLGWTVVDVNLRGINFLNKKAVWESNKYFVLKKTLYYYVKMGIMAELIVVWESQKPLGFKSNNIFFEHVNYGWNNYQNSTRNLNDLGVKTLTFLSSQTKWNWLIKNWIKLY